MVSVTSMGAPVLAMPRAYHASGSCAVVRRAAPVRGATARMRFLISAHAASMGLKSCEYGVKKRIVAPACWNERADASRLVRSQIVEDDDVSATEAQHESTLHPLGKPRRRHRAPRGAHRQPPIDAHRADQRQVVAPVPRPRLDQLTTPKHPRVRAPHRQIGARFVEKDHAADIDAAKPVAEGAPLPLDYRTVLLGRPRAFFLKTYPVRCNARNTLDRWTCASGAARSLYTRVNSWVVRSGRSLIRACSNEMSTGEYQPPPRGAGSTVPRSRAPWTQRTNVLMWTEKRAATSAYVSALPSYTLTARSRSAVGYGFGMHVIDHRSITNSSEYRD